MTMQAGTADGWREVIAPLAELIDLDQTARATGAFHRRRGVPDAQTLLRLALAWAVGGLSLRAAAAWADLEQVAELCDSALMRRLRNAADWMETLTQGVIGARAGAAQALGAQGRLIRPG